MKRNKRKVVVTGLGMVTPLGLDVEETWTRLLAGESGVRRISCPETTHSPIQAVGDVREEDWRVITEAFPDEAGREGERRTLFALWAAERALSDAGLTGSALSGRRSGVMLATGIGINRLEDIHRWTLANGTFDALRFGSEFSAVHAESIVRNHSHRPAALIAKRYGLRGPNATLTTACASTTQAIGFSFRSIRRGEADIMVAGGTDSMINPVGLVFFVLLGAASTTADDPASACRPFDRKRSGLVMGEGAGMVVLEEEDHALSRGATIYAEVAGFGTSLDAYRITAPHPEGRGAIQAMRASLDDAGLEPDAIDYINAHGTGTKRNDVVETEAIKQLFGDHAYRMAVSSTKSMMGHLLCAAGGPEFAFTVLSVNRDRVHPTINLTSPDPKCDLDYVPHVMKERDIRAAISNSFGFGGQNASIVVRKYRRDI